MVHCKNRTPYWIDWRLTGLAEPDYGATISFGLPIEPEDSQYGKYRILPQHTVALRRAKSLELPQNGFLRGNQGSWHACPSVCDRYSTTIWPVMPKDSWGMQMRLYVPALANSNVNNSVVPASIDTSIPSSSTVNVWNSV